MQPANAGPRDLHTVLINYLRQVGATIRYAFLHEDAHWHASTATLTLRADADPAAHIEILRDFIGMTHPQLRYPSHLGARPRRHLQAVG